MVSFLTPSPIQHLCVRVLAPAGCRGPRGERNLTQPLPSWGFPPRSVVRQIIGKVSETWVDRRFHHYWLECSGRRSYRTWAGLCISQTSAGALPRRCPRQFIFTCTLVCLPISDETEDICIRFGDENKKRRCLRWMIGSRLEKS